MQQQCHRGLCSGTLAGMRLLGWHACKPVLIKRYGYGVAAKLANADTTELGARRKASPKTVRAVSNSAQQVAFSAPAAALSLRSSFHSAAMLSKSVRQKRDKVRCGARARA